MDQGSDLVITRLDAPPSVRDGSTLTVTAQVCNRGDAVASGNGPTLLQVYLSTTPTQQVPAPGTPPPSGQTLVGEVDVGPVDPGACVTRTVSGPAIAPPGPQPVTALYLGASVDTTQQVQELDEANNGFVKGRMGVGTGADLVITEVKAPANVRDNAPFLTEVRVCNVGTAPSSSTTQAGIYVSTQPTLSVPAPGAPSPSQVKVGEAFVPGLDAGACIRVRTQAQAQRPPDASLPTQPLYVGAIVDASGSEPELREDNNTHVAGRMGVGMGPDLTVTGVVAPSNFRHGETARTSVTVCNVGMAPSSPTTVAVRLATQPSLTPLPQPPSPTTEADIGATQLLLRLEPGQCTQVKVSGPASAPSGWQPGQRLYLGATVGGGSPSGPELREDNNTFVKGAVGLGEGPDLVVQSLKAPANLRSSGGFSAEARVCNVGTAPLTSSARLELFLSTEDPVVLPAQPGPFATPTQTPVGGVDLWRLEAGQCTTVPVNANTSPPPEFQPGKPLYLGAVIDTFRNIQELQEDNNVFTHGRVGVGDGPDLVVTGVQAPTNLRDGQSFTASYTVCNVGYIPISDYAVSLYLSVDAAPPALAPSQSPGPRTGYALLGRETSYAHLEPQRCATRSATFHAMRPYPSGPWDGPGIWHLSAVVDTGTQETRLDNNGFAAGPVGVGDGPDLVVTEVQGPASVRENETFTTRVKVCNVGTQPANGTAPVAVYLGTEAVLRTPSQNAPPSSDDIQVLVGMLDVPPLAVGMCETRELNGRASRPYRATPDQPLYLGAVADPQARMQELREDNNTRVAGVLSVGSGPDLVITSLDAPDSASTYETFIASARVCNVGTEPSYGARIAFVLSTEATWELPPVGDLMPFPAPTQMVLTEGSIPELPAGECKTLTRTMRPMPPPGAAPDQPVYLSAVAEPYRWAQAELRRDNNIHVRGRLGIGNGPDLIATSVTAPPGVLRWVPFTTSVTVCNHGITPSPSGVRATLHLLTNPSLPLPSPQNYPPHEELLAEGSIPEVGPHACVSFPMESIARGYGMQMAGPLFYVGITLDPNARVAEVRKDNNTFISPRRLAVGSAPDLVITSMGGPASVRPDTEMTVPVTVCNQGTQPAQPRTVSIVLSTEPTLPQPPAQGGPLPPSSPVAVLGSVEIPDLPVNACATREQNVPVSLPQGASPGAVFYLGAAVNGAGPGVELRTDNDSFVRGRIGVGNAPDLVITNVTAPFSVRKDEPFTTQVTVCNQGTENFYWGGQVELYLSTQPTLRFPGTGMSPSQVLLGNLPMNSLLAGQCTTSALTATASWLPEGQGSGLFYLGALVDSQRSVTELREDNNAFVESFLAVLP